jgi:predicted RNA-binding protein Jag
MHTLGHILQSIHNLRRHVIMARNELDVSVPIDIEKYARLAKQCFIETTVTESLEDRMRIAADTLDYVEKELERLED